jgi:hypothetical protein
VVLVRAFLPRHDPVHANQRRGIGTSPAGPARYAAPADRGAAAGLSRRSDGGPDVSPLPGNRSVQLP